MNLQQLKYVKALVDEGSFVAAAARCAVTQPTLSNGIAQLEAELGHRLFRRTTRSVRLTAYGEHLLPAILDVLQSLENLTIRSKSQIEKSAFCVQVGLSPIVGIRRAEAILSRFRTKHPDTDIVYRENNFRDLCDLLRRRQVDIIISPYDASLPIDDDCMLLSLESDPLVFVPRLCDRHQWINTDNVTLADIAHETFVLVPDTCGLTSCTKNIFEVNNLILRRHAGEASSYSAVQEWAQMGISSGILPKSRLKDDGSASIPIVHNGHPVTIDYFAVGKPSTVSPQLFSQLWDSLLEAKIVQPQIAQSSFSPDRQLRLTRPPL
jgi:DNA-binding transcriptional LysR family regulator